MHVKSQFNKEYSEHWLVIQTETKNWFSDFSYKENHYKFGKIKKTSKIKKHSLWRSTNSGSGKKGMKTFIYDIYISNK